MKIIKVVLALVLFFCINPATAQFSISKVSPSKSGEKIAWDTIQILRGSDNITNEFFSKAYWKAEQKKKRKERNDVTLTSSLGLSQTKFDNWVEGGDNTFSGAASIYFLHAHRRKKFSIQEQFSANYGLNYIEKKRFKNVDNFKAIVTSNWAINDKWSYSANTSFESQFSTSYKSRTDNTRVSTLLTPAIFTVDMGIRYAKAPFSVTISPIGGNGRFYKDKSFINTDLGGIPVGKTSLWQVGPSIRANLDYTFAKNKCTVRSNYYSFSNTKRAPTMDWDGTFEYRFNRFMTASFIAWARYNKEASTAVQYKHLITVNLSYTFKNK